MMWLLPMLTAAHAANGVDGLVLPGASPLESRASVGAFGGAAVVILGGGGTQAGGEASLGLTERVALFGFAFAADDIVEPGYAPALHQVVALR